MAEYLDDSSDLRNGVVCSGGSKGCKEPIPRYLKSRAMFCFVCGILCFIFGISQFLRTILLDLSQYTHYARHESIAYSSRPSIALESYENKGGFDYSPATMPKDPRIYFIHIGKAGGSTLHEAFDRVWKRSALPCRMNKTLAGERDDVCDDGQVRGDSQSQFSRHILSHYHLKSPLYTSEQKKWLLEHTGV